MPFCLLYFNFNHVYDFNHVFSCEEDRSEAMKTLDGHEWRGKHLAVKVRRYDDESRLFF